MRSDRYHAYCHPAFRHQRALRRRFLTNEEKKELQERHKEQKIQWLERYQESLEKELKGVTERIDELKKEKE
jgi:Ulp1 family protease